MPPTAMMAPEADEHLGEVDQAHGGRDDIDERHPAANVFGCLSGSSVADTAAVGSVMIPQMIKHGYPRLFAVNVTISGSLQPLLLPPSHNMIIYSLAAGGTISVAQLFMGGVVPALLLGLSLIVLVLVIAHRENFPKGEVVPLRQALRIALDAIWGLITIVIIQIGRAHV